jgi:hypothetical protein
MDCVYSSSSIFPSERTAVLEEGDAKKSDPAKRGQLFSAIAGKYRSYEFVKVLSMHVAKRMNNLPEVSSFHLG